MTLHPLVAVLGGDLYQGGMRANVPAPGHSTEDRSISLFLSEGRVLIHGFGGVDWRAMREDLQRRGLIDRAGRLRGSAGATRASVRPDASARIRIAEDLWSEGRPLESRDRAALYLARRCAEPRPGTANLRLHPDAPLSVYAAGGPSRGALMARISDADDRLTAVELTYLEPNGSAATGLRVPRKTVGRVPAGAAVRLGPAAPQMLVAEGVVTTLSAMARFHLPGWALRAAQNLSVWTPPGVVRRVLIAADRGSAGEAAALTLQARLKRRGLSAEAIWPDAPYGDWNEIAVALRKEERGR